MSTLKQKSLPILNSILPLIGWEMKDIMWNMCSLALGKKICPMNENQEGKQACLR